MISCRRFSIPACAVWLQCVAALLLWGFAQCAVSASTVAVLTDGQRLMLPGYIDFMPDSPDIQPDKLLDGEYESLFRHYDEPAVRLT